VAHRLVDEHDVDVAAQVGAMAVSHDGSTLYTVDTTNFTIVPVNLDTLARGAPMSPGSLPLYVEYTRTNGVELVISGNGKLFNAKTGTALAPTFSGGYYGYVVVAAARNGSRLCTIDTGLSPYSLACYTLDYTSANGGQLLLTGAGGGLGFGSFGVGSNGQDVAVNADGTRVYVASGAPYEFDVFDTANMSLVQRLPGDAYPDNVEVAADGRIFAGAFTTSSPGIWVYAPGGALLHQYAAGGFNLGAGQLKVSGDGLRMSTVADKLYFTTVGP